MKIIRATLDGEVIIGFLDPRYDYSNRECYQLERIQNPGCFIAIRKENCEDITHLYYSLPS